MNETAIRMEEQIISLFPGMDTLSWHGWILKKMERHFCVYPLYYKFSEGNIPGNIQRCEETSRQSGIVGELFLPDSESSICRIEEGSNRLSLRKGADEGDVAMEDIPETEELPEKYKQAGFSRIYLYRCYQKEEKSSPKQED